MGSNPTVSAQLVPTLSTAHTRGEEGPNHSIAPGFHRTEVGLSTYPGSAQPSTGLGSKCGGVPRKWVDGPMEIVATARERLVLARDHGCAGTREVVRSEGLTRIGRGMYLRVESTWEPWERARVVNAARTIAALDGREGERACLVSAVVLRDLPLWQVPATVDVLVPRPGWRLPVQLPAVLGGEDTPEVMHRHGYTVPESDHDVVDGVPTVGLHRLALDVALQWHPRDALVTVDGIMARLAAPDRGDREGTDRRAAGVRADMSARLAAMPRRPGLGKAKAVIAAASPWSESPGESVTRWAALAIGMAEPVCQYRFTRSNGRFFYLDQFWDEYGSGAEFDGLVKYKGDQGSHVVVAEKKRDDEIRRTGINLLHLDTPTANRPALLAAALRGLMPRSAAAKMRPRAGLWTPDLGPWRSE